MNVGAIPCGCPTPNRQFKSHQFKTNFQIKKPRLSNMTNEVNSLMKKY